MSVDLEFLRERRAKVEAAWEAYSASEYKNSLRAHDAWFDAKADFEQSAVKYVNQLLFESTPGMEAEGRDAQQLGAQPDSPVGAAEAPHPLTDPQSDPTPTAGE